MAHNVLIGGDLHKSKQIIIPFPFSLFGAEEEEFKIFPRGFFQKVPQK